MRVDDYVERLFHRLADLSADERRRALDDEGISPLLRAEVESLLANDDPNGATLDDVIQGVVAIGFDSPLAAFPRCGPYRLLKLIGDGGMGSVYIAERTDGTIRQTVAIKLLRISMDTLDARQLFQRERQILADLSHPNIAHLLDAGRAEDGRPFLAMEYVDGTPIDELCDQLPLRQRVELVEALCGAIVYAHRMLVVHRDLKPSNVLVDANGAPKLLDFGIAKLIDANKDVTATVERRLTPTYASPEQILGSPVGAASDVFSLGALLYRLTSGQLPFRSEDFSTRSELQRAVCQIQPVRPSKWNSKIDKDLDAIILRAMRKEPNERYASADAFREDLRAWLDRAPVRAREGSWWYLARRHLRRYWIPATATAVTVVGLAVGLGVALHERDVAKRRFEDVHKFANEMLKIGRDISELPGVTPEREQLVRTSLSYLERLSRDAGNDLDLQVDIGSAYRTVAVVQGGIRTTNLGRPDDALSSLAKSETLLRDAWKRQPGDARVLHSLLLTVAAQSRLDEGLRRTRSLRERLSELHTLALNFERIAPDKANKWATLSDTYDTLAQGSDKIGNIPDGLRFARQSIDFQKKLVSLSSNRYTNGNLALSLESYGSLLRSAGNLEGALRAMRQGLAILEQIAGSVQDDFVLILNLGATHADIGAMLRDERVLMSSGDMTAAVSELKRSLDFFRRNVRLDASEDEARVGLGSSATELGNLLREENPRSALAAYDEAIAAFRAMPAQTSRRNFPLSIALSESVFPLRKLGRNLEAQKRLTEAKQLAEKAVGPEANDSDSLADPWEAISRVEADEFLSTGHPAEAIRLHQAWLQQPGSKSHFPHTRLQDALVVTARYKMLAAACRFAGRRDEEGKALRKRQELLEFWKQRSSN